MEADIESNNRQIETERQETAEMEKKIRKLRVELGKITEIESTPPLKQTPQTNWGFGASNFGTPNAFDTTPNSTTPNAFSTTPNAFGSPVADPFTSSSAFGGEPFGQSTAD